MTYEYQKITKGKPVLFLYERDDGSVVSRIINKDLENVPYWFYQSQALFLPMTPPALRLSLFNRTVGEHYKKGPQQYATRIDYHDDEEIGPFLAIYLTQAGVEMVGKANSKSSKQLYDPQSPPALSQWRGFKKPLRQALKKLNLTPSRIQT